MVAVLAQRWLREANDTLSPTEKLAFARQIALASGSRDRALNKLNLNRDTSAEISAFYAPSVADVGSSGESGPDTLPTIRTLQRARVRLRMQREQLERLADPVEFRKWYRIPTDDGPKPWVDVAEPRQITDHDAMLPGIRRAMGVPAESGPSMCYLERPRAGGKTTDAAMIAANILVGSRRPSCRGLGFGQDKDQARLLRDTVSDGIVSTPGLDRLLSVQAYRIANVHNGAMLDIMASDVASSGGPTPTFVLVDELTHWSAQDLWDSLVTSSGKSRDCILIVGSNAGLGKGSSWHWRLREQFRTDPELYFSRYEHPPARMTPERLARQERLVTASTFRRVWLNEWLSEAGDALSSDDIQAAITLDSPSFYQENGHSYVGGLAPIPFN